MPGGDCCCCSGCWRDEWFPWVLTVEVDCWYLVVDDGGLIVGVVILPRLLTVELLVTLLLLKPRSITGMDEEIFDELLRWL